MKSKFFKNLKPEKGYQELWTKEGEALTGVPWTDYPRPQLRRDSYINLNGKWEFSITYSNHIPNEFPLEILVPFPPESLLSGIHKVPSRNQYSYYRRRFNIPKDFIKDKVLLHFGAVDQIATVYINGQECMTHEGGYLPFYVDITEYLKENNELVVKVKDTLSHRFPYGKQKKRRGGMWYTPVSGIWQTVWMESVSKNYIKNLRITPTLNSVTIQVETDATLKEISIYTEQGTITKEFFGNEVNLTLSNPKHWSPEQPYLYEFQIRTAHDTIRSYFALRTLEIKVVDGFKRLCLNDKPYFFHGLLDQGYFSDGIYLPASPQGFLNDIITMKELGFNTLRKHIKIEPAMFYYYCDKYGMIVFQDMVNNGHYSFLRDTAIPSIGFIRINDRLLYRTKAVKENFIKYTKDTIEYLYNFPSICYWTIFNEGWGQFESDTIYDFIKLFDDTRFIDSTSGWFLQKRSDVLSRHIYFIPIDINTDGRPLVLSEFGGYSYKIPEHSFNLKNTYGYRFFHNQKDFQKALNDLYLKEIVKHLKKGLCAAIYTQVSDVEDETNGLFTYDRRVLKVDKDEMHAIAEKLKLK